MQQIERDSNIAKILIIFFCLIWAVFYSMTMTINVPVNHLDGAFQTASGLFRLDAGQFPGRDFFPYLGVAPLFLIYPFFKIFGSNFAASVVSAQFIVLMVGVLSVSLIWHLLWKPRSFLTSLTAGCILFLITKVIAVLFFIHLPEWFNFATTPGNSLRPIRAAAPYLLVAVYSLFISNINSEKNRYILSGIFAGLVLLWSNDFAVVCFGLFSLFIVVNAAQHKELTLQNMFWYVFSCLVSWIVILILATKGNPLNLLKYNFLGVAKDQWWYFAPYSGSFRIFSILQLNLFFVKNIIFHNNIFSFMSVIWIAILIRKQLTEYILIALIGAILFAGGMVSSIIGHIDYGYFSAYCFWSIVTFTILLIRLVWLGICAVIKHENLKQTIVWYLTAFFAIVSFLAVICARSSFKLQMSETKKDPKMFYVHELGGFVNKNWKEYIKLIRDTDANLVIEEYWGIWSAINKKPSVWPVDSVIHALGNVREIAKNKLASADIIISTRKDFSRDWQPWSVSQNFWFYDELIKRFTPYKLSPTTVVWKKTDNIRVLKEVACHVDKKTQSLVLNAPRPGFYKVEVNYEFSGSRKFIIMIRNNMSFVIGTKGYVSLDSQHRGPQITTFPVYIAKAGLNMLDTKVIGISSFQLKLISCAAYYIPFISTNVF